MNRATSALEQAARALAAYPRGANVVGSHQAVPIALLDAVRDAVRDLDAAIATTVSGARVHAPGKCDGEIVDGRCERCGYVSPFGP